MVKRDGRHIGDAGQPLGLDRGQNHLDNTDANDGTQGNRVAQLAGVGFIQCIRLHFHRSKFLDCCVAGVLSERTARPQCGNTEE